MKPGFADGDAVRADHRMTCRILIWTSVGAAVEQPAGEEHQISFQSNRQLERRETAARPTVFRSRHRHAQIHDRQENRCQQRRRSQERAGRRTPSSRGTAHHHFRRFSGIGRFGRADGGGFRNRERPRVHSPPHSSSNGTRRSLRRLSQPLDVAFRVLSLRICSSTIFAGSRTRFSASRRERLHLRTVEKRSEAEENSIAPATEIPSARRAGSPPPGSPAAAGSSRAGTNRIP